MLKFARSNIYELAVDDLLANDLAFDVVLQEAGQRVMHRFHKIGLIAHQLVGLATSVLVDDRDDLALFLGGTSRLGVGKITAGDGY